MVYLDKILESMSMEKEDLLKRIIRDPKIMLAKPTIKGT